VDHVPASPAPPPPVVLQPGLYQPGKSDGLEVISDASRELRALALLSGSLTDPLTAEDAANVIERQALSVLGATSAVVVTLGDFPPSQADGRASIPSFRGITSLTAGRDVLTLVHAVGVSAHVEAALRQLRLDAPVPLAVVARTGEPIFLKSEQELRQYPEWGDTIVRAGSCAAAAVPVWANGHLRGVLGLTWTTPHAFDEDERAFVITLGVMCAQAIMRGHLASAERKARENAEHANLAKTQFLRTISHELRTPLTAVVGYTELLEDEVVGPVTQVQKDHLRSIRRSSGHLLALIEELLHFAQLEAGAEVLQLETVVAGSVIVETMDIVRPIAIHKGVAIKFDDTLADQTLRTDRLKLRQILVNLLNNAVKYTQHGEAAIALRVQNVGEAKTLVFEVTDTGVGVVAGDREHIFEAFWQVDQSLTRMTGGSGLGLSVARGLARLLGGDVTLVRSEVGKGSTFAASLPIDGPAESPLSAVPPHSPA
jgi:signal transduction histidine kinase